MAEIFGFECYAPREIAERVENIGVTKTNLPLLSQVALGVLAGGFIGLGAMFFTLVAVWLAMAGRTVTDKVLALVFPIAAFVACGFEHSVANMYFIPLGIFLREQVAAAGAANLHALNWFSLVRNLLPVTLGNLLGGAGMVGLVYWLIYRRRAFRSSTKTHSQ